MSKRSMVIKMKKIINYISVISFFVILIMFAVSTLFFQNSLSFSNEKKKTQSIKNASENYITDNFPLTNNWKALYTNALVFLGKEQFDNVYILDDKLVEVFDKIDSEKLENNISKINTFAENTDNQVYVMISPTASGIYSSMLPSYATQIDQKKVIDDVYYKLDKTVETIDAFYPLYSARDEYIFYRTDNKWTSFGSYYAYVEAIKKLGFEPITMQNYDLDYASQGFYGSLHNKVYYNKIQSDRINLFRSKYQSPVTSVQLYDGEQVLKSNSVYFRSALKTENKTDIYLEGNNYEKAVVKTSVENAPKLLVIKGDYANTLIPFLTPHYSEITAVDLDRLKENGKKLNEIVNIDDYDQILIMYDIDNFARLDSFDLLENK